MKFKKGDIISMKDFSREEIDHVLETAEDLEDKIREVSHLLNGKIMANLFFEPSTRTRLSFETAMKRLGGEVLNLNAMEASSMAKGESLADTIRVISQYCDLIVLRHPMEGSARLAAQFSSVPIINAGDGAGHHPTQTLLDLYTIKRESSLHNLKIALVGDLRYGRTVHSLTYALALYNAKIFLVSPEQLRMPEEIKNDIKELDGEVSETTGIKEIIQDVDVLYVTRIQKERFPDVEEYNRVANAYRISTDVIRDAKEELIVMHPLPRVGEIDAEVDLTGHARYFEQAFYGVPVRMALLYLLMS
jgi:aspartate carbamoyltransferase catalytic subunit